MIPEPFEPKQDAEAVIARMREEGHKPDTACVVHLMRSYSEADPPQAAQAEKSMEKFRKEGIPITTAACNYIVQAWCKVGGEPENLHPQSSKLATRGPPSSHSAILSH